MDRLRALEVLVAVDDVGSLVGAARRLGMSPPSVTRILGELEAHLETPLLRRSTRSVHPTEAGFAYLERARRILEAMEEADASARGDRSEPSGHLRVTAPATFGPLYVAPILYTLMDRFPKITVDADFSDRVLHLLEDRIDVAVRIGPLEDSGLQAIKVGSVRPVVCASPAYLERQVPPKTLDDLPEHELVGLRLDSPRVRWHFGRGRRIDVEPRLTVNSVAAALDAARAGRGLTRVLSYQAAMGLASGELVEVLEDEAPPAIPIHLLHAEAKQTSAKVRAFLDLAVSGLRADPRLSR